MSPIDGCPPWSTFSKLILTKFNHTCNFSLRIWKIYFHFTLVLYNAYDFQITLPLNKDGHQALILAS